jgi:putative oxidoreductase
MSSLGVFLDRHSERIYALMRIVVPLIYLCHGAQKLFGVLGGHLVWGGSPLFIAAGLIEMSCGPLMVLGLFTRPAAFIASGEMAVAYFLMHLPRGPWPILNHGELAVVFCFVFLYIAAHGPGIWSVDRLWLTGKGSASSS